MKRPLRIILVDEDARSAALVEAALRAEFANLHPQSIAGADLFARALAAGEFALAITEHKLSWSDAIQVTRAIKLRRGNTPVIVFTNAGDEAAAVAAMKAGADDYIGKAADRIGRLLAAVRAAISGTQQPASALAPNRTNASVQYLRAAPENLPISIFGPRGNRGKPPRILGTVQDLTERQQAQDALKLSEQRFATFMNHLPGAAFIRDRQGNYLYCNPVEMQRLKRPSAWRGKNLDDLWPADVAALARQSDLGVLESGQAMQYILNTSDTDGPPYWLVTKFPILDEQGAAQLIGGIGIDITERKHVEEQLRATQARLQFLLSSTPAVIYTCKAGDEHAAAFVSDNVTAQLGYQAREFVGDPQFWRSRVHPDDVERVLSGLCGKTGEDRHTLEYRFQHRDGTYRWLLDEARLIKDGDGVPLEIAGYLIDITKRKTAEAEVASHARQMAEAQRVAHVGSWELDLQTKALRWSEEHYHVFGVEPGKFEVSYAAARQLVHPDDREAVRQTLEATAKAGGSFNMHFRIVGQDGKERHIYSRAETLVNSSGRAVRMLGTVQDITERKRFEDALQESERQLSEALEQRERLFQDLHDSIIQIIYAVGLSLEECQRLIDEGRGAVAERTITEAISNLNSAIRDIRKFILGHDARILTGTQLRAELADLARSVMAAQLLRLRVSVDPMAASQLTSEEAQHVLCIAREAMSNSLRHSRARSGMVSLRANRSSVRLEVRDDGVGFDVQQVAWRGEGLRNIAARARLMGARLDISSQPGSGTRIVVNLPKETAHGSGRSRENALADR